MKRAIITALVLVTGLFCLFASDWEIRRYDVSINVGTNAVHSVDEVLDVYFHARHHGIVREIPVDYSDYNGMNAHVRALKVSDDYDTDTDNGYLVIRIGDADKYVIGDKRYGISYSYDIGADTNSGYDEFYMNIIGTEWECPIEDVHFSVRIPYQSRLFSSRSDFLSYVDSPENLHFTSGRWGSSTSGGTLEYSVTLDDDGSVVIEGSMSGLSPYEGLTLRLDLPDLWYQGARERWDHRAPFNVIAPLVTVLLLALAVIVWFTKGRDKIPIVTARFDAPFGFSPMFVGYLADGSVDDKDVTSMLYYWADEGLLKIHEISKDEFEFEKTKDIEAYAIENGKEIPAAELRLFNGFFKDCEVGEIVTFKDLEKSDFYDVMQNAKILTRSYFTKDRSLSDRRLKGTSALFSFLSIVPLSLNILRLFLVENSSPMALFHIVLCGLLFFVNLWLWDSFVKRYDSSRSHTIMFILRFIPTLLASALGALLSRASGDAFEAISSVCIVGSGLVSFFAAIIGRRTPYGTEVLEGVLGYREFIDKAEISQLRMMIDQDPDFYYRTLSYAIVYGLEDKWARKFKAMVVEPPTWYVGTSVLDFYYISTMSRMLSRSIVSQAIKSHISSSASSHAGGSGFRMSGFSGGGFGGGGGHAW